MTTEWIVISSLAPYHTTIYDGWIIYQKYLRVQKVISLTSLVHFTTLLWFWFADSQPPNIIEYVWYSLKYMWLFVQTCVNSSWHFIKRQWFQKIPPRCNLGRSILLIVWIYPGKFTLFQVLYLKTEVSSFFPVENNGGSWLTLVAFVPTAPACVYTNDSICTNGLTKQQTTREANKHAH